MVLVFIPVTCKSQITEKNLSLAPDDARRCAEKGDPECQAKLGWFYENGYSGVKEDHEQAVLWYRRAAEQGLVPAQTSLASIYENGYHVPQDYAQAARWYERAAQAGDASAQGKIAGFYWVGKGVLKNLVQAHMWANLAAVGEQNKYQDRIDAVLAGPGTKEEKEEVIRVFRDSRVEPIKLAIRVRELIEGEMTPTQIAEAQKLAREWKPVVHK
jgi:hypothetical protein